MIIYYQINIILEDIYVKCKYIHIQILGTKHAYHLLIKTKKVWHFQILITSHSLAS
jgi:hypothetical protein